jgi:hypothetical protein
LSARSMISLAVCARKSLLYLTVRSSQNLTRRYEGFWELLTVRYSRDFRAQTAREIIDLADNPTVRDEGLPYSKKFPEFDEKV